MFKYRDHREMLVDSMKTVKEFETKADLIKYLQSSLDKYGKGKYDCSKITVEQYGDGIDKRIGWKTHIVHLEGFGVLGFTDGAV